MRGRGVSRGGSAVLAATLLAGLSACFGTPAHKALAAPGPMFDPLAFFAGPTVGEGTLRIDVKGATHTHVTGEGRVEPDGALVLVQHVMQGDKPATTRTWRLRAAGERRYAGTLTDAVGPVSASVQGNLLDIRYTMKGGFAVEQWLYLQPGGQVALNRMVVRKFGLPVAALDETIRRLP